MDTICFRTPLVAGDKSKLCIKAFLYKTYQYYVVVNSHRKPILRG